MSAPDEVVAALMTHSVECTGLGEVTCRSCRERGWMSWHEFYRHQADAAHKASLKWAAAKVESDCSEDDWGVRSVYAGTLLSWAEGEPVS